MYDDKDLNNKDRDSDNEGNNDNEGSGEYRYKRQDEDFNDNFVDSYNNYSSDSYNDVNYNSPNNDQNQYNKGSNNSYEEKKPGKIKRGFSFVLKALAFGVIAGLAFIATNEVVYTINPDLNNGNSIFTADEDKFTIEQTKTTNDTIVDTDVTGVAQETMASVVTINGTFTETYSFFGQQVDEENQGSGSGIIIEQNDTELLIATNNHVVEGAKPIEVTFVDGESAEAIIKGTDSVADLAVIAVDLNDLSEETKSAIKIANLLEDGDVKVGEKVVAIGNALGIGQSVTVGYVSAVDREVEVDNNVMTLIQTDAAINPGNSGGALLNMDGEVIGINTVKFAANEVEGMGYAIPINRATPILNELKSREVIAEEEKGYLGVGIRDVTEDIAEMFNWPVGVYVSEVTPGGPADEAGILKGDIIVGLNDIDITSTTQLIEKVTSYRAGDEVTVKLMRSQGNEYEELSIQVTLGKATSNQPIEENR